MSNFWKLISTQAKLAVMGYLLVLTSTVLTAIYTKGVTLRLVVSSMFFILISALSVYVLNCTVTGKCILYAWIMGWIIVVLGMMTVFSAVAILMKN